MIDVRLIAAVGRRGQLGLGGKLPWSDPIDLRWFKETTMDAIVLMGGRTYDTVGVLPGRFRARWSGKTSPFAVLQQLTDRYKGKVIWIAGGSYTYAAFMPFVRIAVITRIDYDGEADTFMPPLWGHDNGHRATHDCEPTPASLDRGREPTPASLPVPPFPEGLEGGSETIPRKRPRQPWLSPRRRHRHRWKRRIT